MGLGLESKFSIVRGNGAIPIPYHSDPATEGPPGSETDSSLPVALKQGGVWVEGTLRTSSYTIYVDLPDTDQEMLLVHGYSGAYDRVSRNVANYLRSLEVKRAPRPLYGSWSAEPPVPGSFTEPSEEAMEVLKRRGYLTTRSPADERAFFAKVAEKLHQKRLLAMPSYIFMPTYDCNLRCPYCFQDHMRTDPRFLRLLRTIKPEVVDRCFAAMPRIEEQHGFEGDPGERHRDIGFFGGEPLMADSRPIVEHIMNRAREMGSAGFWAISNGTELEAYEDLLGPEGLASIQITLDGPPGEHDQRRIYADGSGSFERIAGNITRALDRGVRISVRLNLDRNNVGDLGELAREMIRRGWTKRANFSAYSAPIRPENDNVDRDHIMNSWELDQALTELREREPETAIFSRPDDTIKAQARQLFHAPETVAPVMRESFCSAHDRMYLFDAFADIYACWERTGDPSIRVGHVEEDGSVTINGGMNKLWRGRTVATNPACLQCRYALHCGGGCAVLAEAKTGKFNSNFCDGFAERFRDSVAESYLAHVAGKPLEAHQGRICDQ